MEDGRFRRFSSFFFFSFAFARKHKAIASYLARATAAASGSNRACARACARLLYFHPRASRGKSDITTSTPDAISTRNKRQIATRWRSSTLTTRRSERFTISLIESIRRKMRADTYRCGVELHNRVDPRTDPPFRRLTLRSFNDEHWH